MGEATADISICCTLLIEQETTTLTKTDTMQNHPDFYFIQAQSTFGSCESQEEYLAMLEGEGLLDSDDFGQYEYDEYDASDDDLAY